MKLKITILLFILSIHCDLFSQNMPSVAGVEFGSTYETCKSILDVRFNGGESSYQSEKNTLSYSGNISFGGETFDYVNFGFQSDGRLTYLNHIEFVSRFDQSDTESAKIMRDRLFLTFKEKYDFRWSKKDYQGFLYYVLGHDPINKEDGFVVISTCRGKTKGGENKVWTEVTYGPTQFISVSDEI